MAQWRACSGSRTRAALTRPDAGKGTPIGDASGWIGTGNTTLAELSTAGGKISLRAGGETIIRAGAMLDVSGGSVRYTDGWITTTKLLGADGRIYDIGNAMPDQQYVGFPGSFMRHHERINLSRTCELYSATP